MDAKYFNILVQETFNECRDLLGLKGAEYAGSSDRLANFKRGAVLTGVSPQQVAFIYLSKHYDAIATFVREGPVPGGEPIQGRLNDLINYCLLLRALIEEEAQLEADIPQ